MMVVLSCVALIVPPPVAVKAAFVVVLAVMPPVKLIVAPVLLVSVMPVSVSVTRPLNATVPPVLLPMLTECAEPLAMVPLKLIEAAPPLTKKLSPVATLSAPLPRLTVPAMAVKETLFVPPFGGETQYAAPS